MNPELQSSSIVGTAGVELSREGTFMAAHWLDPGGFAPTLHPAEMMKPTPAQPSQPSVKVCLHVVRAARTDVRAMRAATALIDAGFAVSIVDLESDYAQPAKEEFHGISMQHIIKPSWHTSMKFEPWFFINAIQTFLFSIRLLLQSRADIYHANEVTALPASYIAAKIRRKPLIFEAYELPLDDIPLSEMGILRRGFHTLLAFLLARMVPGCAAVITVSPPIVQEMKSRYHHSRVALVRNILPYQVAPEPKPDRLRQHLGLHRGVRIALYQGNLQPDRGLDTLVHAAEFLDEDRIIVMMGKNVGTTQKRLESLIRSKGVSHRVKIIPPVPYEELLDWTASADLGLTLIPLDYTLNMKMCLPNKLFEYLMAGLPILSAPLEAVTDIIRSYDVGRIVAALAPIEVAHAINAIFSDADTLERMHSNALNAAKELCWEKEGQQLIRLYADILTIQSE